MWKRHCVTTISRQEVSLKTETDYTIGTMYMDALQSSVCLLLDVGCDLRTSCHKLNLANLMPSPKEVDGELLHKQILPDNLLYGSKRMGSIEIVEIRLQEVSGGWFLREHILLNVG